MQRADKVNGPIRTIVLHYVIFLASLALYLYQRAMREAAAAGVAEHRSVQEGTEKAV